MLKQDRHTGGWHQAARKLIATARLTPRWLQAVGTLALTLAIISAGQFPVAQARELASVVYHMDVASPKTTFCTNEQGTFNVTITGSIIPAPGDTPDDVALPFETGTEVDATGYDPKVISETDFPTSAPGSALQGLKPYTAVHHFKAGSKPGATTILFSGKVRVQFAGQPGVVIYPVSFEVPVKVLECKFWVTLHSHWYTVVAAGDTIGIDAHSEAVMTADSKGHYSEDGAGITWTPTVGLPPECSHVDKISSTTLDVTGDVTGTGQFIFKLTFKPTTLTEKGKCVFKKSSVVINTSNTLTSQPLVFTVPVEGGSLTLSHVLTGGGITLVGEASVSVTRVGYGGD